MFVQNQQKLKSVFAGSNLNAFLQAWKLREEGRLLDIVDPELRQYPENEVTRFIKVALFCTQAGAYQRPSMKQVVEMLSKEVSLNEDILTEPGVYRIRSSHHFGGSSSETSSSQKKKGKLSINLDISSAQLVSTDSVTQMLPR